MNTVQGVEGEGGREYKKLMLLRKQCVLIEQTNVKEVVNGSLKEVCARRSRDRSPKEMWIKVKF